MSTDLTTPANALPVALSDMEQDAGVGLENLSMNDMAVPFLTLLQAMSPQVKRGPAKIEGAEEGDFFNSVTNEVIKGADGVRVIPCAYQKRFVEWIPHDNGGGFVGTHLEMPADATKNERGKMMLPNGNEIVETAYHYVILLHANGNRSRAIVSMTSTQLKKSRRWNSLISGIKLEGKAGKFTPPMFSHSYLLSSMEESGGGYNWVGWIVSAPELLTDGALYQEAKQFNDTIKAGDVKVAEPPAPEKAESAGEHF